MAQNLKTTQTSDQLQRDRARQPARYARPAHLAAPAGSMKRLRAALAKLDARRQVRS